jgi:prepilin peptidase CpaA
MAAEQYLWLCAVLVSAVAGWIDWRSRRIPNWLTVPCLGLGLVANTTVLGWQGPREFLAGVALALTVLFPLVWIRALGAGDWKLMGALGGILGPLHIALVIGATVLISVIMAVIQVSWQKRWLAALTNLLELVRGFLVFGLKKHPRISLDNPAMPSLPFGVAAALATILCAWGLRVSF